MFVSASDSTGAQTGVNVPRLITSSATAGLTATNSQVTNYAASGNAGGLFSFFGTGGLSVTGAGNAAPAWDTNFGLGATSLGLLDQAMNLFYFIRTVGTGSSTGAATGGAYANSLNQASVTLASNGDFSYSLAPAGVATVPLPAAAWLLGAGLLGIGGFVRRRRTEQQ